MVSLKCSTLRRVENWGNSISWSCVLGALWQDSETTGNLILTSQCTAQPCHQWPSLRLFFFEDPIECCLLFNVTNGLCETLSMNAVPSQWGLLAELSLFTQGCRREGASHGKLASWNCSLQRAPCQLGMKWMNPSLFALGQSSSAVWN